MEPGLLGALRVWTGLPAGTEYLKWAAVPTLANELRPKAIVHGFFAGQPGAPDATAARKALVLILRGAPSTGIVVLMRDSDGDWRRKEGLRQALASGTWSFGVVIGVPHTKRECWLLAAFEPCDDRERTLIETARQELGFDPRLRSHELTATKDGSKRSAKRVLEVLSNADVDRQESGIRETPLGTLEERGKENGLSEFLDEIKAVVIPEFSGGG